MLLSYNSKAHKEMLPSLCILMTRHGSGKNESRSRPRRGLGLHFVPAEVKFTPDACKSSLWRSYVEGFDDASKVPLSEDDFPITWKPPEKRDLTK